MAVTAWAPEISIFSDADSDDSSDCDPYIQRTPRSTAKRLSRKKEVRRRSKTAPSTPPRKRVAVQTPSAPTKLLSLHRQQCKRRIIKERQRLAEAPLSPLHIMAFPHILEAVLYNTDERSLRALRATCREVKHEVDRLVALHARVHVKLPEDWSMLRTRFTTEPPPAVCRTVVGATVHKQTVSVLDVSPWTARMWDLCLTPEWSEEQHEQNTGNLPFRTPQWQEKWAARNRYWFDLDDATKLVRYTGGLGMDKYKFFVSTQAMKANPCSVVFGDWSAFTNGLAKVDSYYATELDGMPVRPIDVVLNVSLYLRALWPNPADLLDLHFVRRVTIIFGFYRGRLGWSHKRKGEAGNVFLELLKLLIRASMRPDGKCTIVGYESWDADMLDVRWEDPTRGTFKPTASIKRRLQYWIKTLAKDIPGARQIEDPIRLLTSKEWRSMIGDDYFRLMTNEDALYRSRQPLEDYGSLITGAARPQGSE